MKLPEGVTEAEALDAIENAVRILAPNYTFGIYDLEDIRQEARIFGMDAMPRYNPRGYLPDGKPRRRLDNFIYSHIRYRLNNLRRDKYRRNDPPCVLCHRGEDHVRGKSCKSYSAWKRRNEAKASLMSPVALDLIPDERQQPERRLSSEVEDRAEMNEVLRRVDEGLDVELRATYLQMRAGKSVPKSRRLQVEEAVKEILRGA